MKDRKMKIIFNFDEKIVVDNGAEKPFSDFWSPIQFPENSDDLLENGWIDNLDYNDIGEIDIIIIENGETTNVKNTDSIFQLAPASWGGKRHGAGRKKSGKKTRQMRIDEDIIAAIENKIAESNENISVREWIERNIRESISK